jgi:hypothetical protein
LATPVARDRDDPAAVVHELDGLLGAEHEGADVHGVRAVEMVGFQVHDLLEGCRGRVVDEHVQAAVLLRDGVEERGHALGGFDVGPDRNRVPAQALGFYHNLGGEFVIRPVVHDDGGALRSQVERESPADASGGPGDHRDLSLIRGLVADRGLAHGVPPCLVSRTTRTRTNRSLTCGVVVMECTSSLLIR